MTKTMKRRAALLTAVVAAVAGIGLAADQPKPKVGYQDTPMLPGGKWHVHDGTRPMAPVITPGTSSTQETAGKAPSDAVVLFDGKDLEHWQSGGKPAKWKVEDGAMVIAPNGGTIASKEKFGDCQIHLEWAAPNPPKGNDQGRGNSGVMIMDHYEIQVLDCFENVTYADGQAAAIYGQYPPLVNASRKPGEWQTYDIIFTAPRFDSDKKLESPAYVTILHNGVLVQNHQALLGPVRFRDLAKYTYHDPKGPIALQDHGSPVRFRNIWVRELKDEPSRSADNGIAAALQPFVDSHSLAGAVTLVANKGEVLSLEAVGFADVAAQKPLKTDALFWIASQSKPITAAAFMMLVDEGKVKLDDPVAKYLPEFNEQKVKVKQDGNFDVLKKPQHPITVREILSHTSGLPFASARETPTLDMLPLRDAVRSYAETPLQTEPGTKYAYSNAGINTAGRIIEVVSGMPYEEFLDKRLFEPLGMKDTTFWPNEEQLTRLAKSYKPDKDKTGLEEITVGQLKYPLNDRTRQPMPAGGLFSTASDIARFCQMVLNGGEFHGKRLLSESAVKQMTSKQTPEALKDGYGLGWSTGGDSFGHGGAYSTNMTIDKKRGLIKVWMVQHAGFPNDGGKSQGAFNKAADEQFGDARK